ncbi:protein strawberry notch homolog 1-like isoform X1 [Pecten maximus]|uniref:protein strawberry notch homolog 1-like isoform X1 n=1 Tax=Pecten maximus TaxID=6579 RepID=UPI0014584736|nr:protein strawberry notch homolog 1-like isoform X1 [Pecten maximus]
MANEANNSFTDILSAALDESGILGDFDDFDEPSVAEPINNVAYQEVPKNQPVTVPVTSWNGNAISQTQVGQSAVFSHALKQLASTSQVIPTVGTLPSQVGNVHQKVALQSTLGRSASSPAMIRIPKSSIQNSVANPNSIPITIQQAASAASGNTTPRIIKITRVGGAQGPIKIPQNSGGITLGSLAGGSFAGKKIIIKRAVSGAGLPNIGGANVGGQGVVGTVQGVSNIGELVPGNRTGVTTHIQQRPFSPQLQPANSPIQIVSQSGSTGRSLQNAVSLLQRSGDSLLIPRTSSTIQVPPSVNSGISYTKNSIVVNSSGTNAVAAGTNIANIKTSLSHKDVSRMWSNEDIKIKNFSAPVIKNMGGGFQHSIAGMSAPTLLEDEEVEDEVEELGHAETYADYMPSKLTVGVKHPDPVVETSSLSSVESSDIWYKLSLPDSTIDYGDLSALQLESIVYASQRHDLILPCGERGGFLIGDGAGVGKGRTIAGIIYENYIQGRKRALWLSVSNDLRVDAERDLRDIGAGRIEVHALNKFKYAKISSKENGSVKKGVIFATYSSLIGESQTGGKYKTRLKQLLKWCGKDFDGCIIFDECHKAKNLCPVGSSKPTKTGQTVLELQNRLPLARIVYASATGASEPKNMAYMTRLGLWGQGTPFLEFNDFIQAVERRGVGAMELVAMDMKLRGMYIARQLSFKGVSFKIEEIPLEKEFEEVYNDAVKMWVVARDRFQKAAELIDAEQRMKKTMWGQFWSAHQRFFKYLCISAKVNHCVKLARDAVRNGKCVVIGLQSTGEARTLEQLEENGGELNDFVSTTKGVFQTLVEKHFPAPDRRKTFDIFGIGGYPRFLDNSNPPTPENRNDRKRKKGQKTSKSAKKQKGNGSSSGSDDSDSDWLRSDSDASSVDFGADSNSESDGDVDDFNPFGNGSDSDDDPWLKKKNKVSNKKKSKKTKKKKKKQKGIDEDEEFDKQLAAAGLMKKNVSTKENINNMGNNNTTNNSSNHPVLGMDSVERAVSMKRELLDTLDEIGDKLPPNLLDHLIDELGGKESVAEMTGRKGRVVCTDEGISYESRSASDVPLEYLNLTEKQRFMDGEKNIAIISEAASSGISLQADRRAINQRRRVHITLELPWSADRAIQQFGRTHRSNQVHAPEYLFLISELAGEQRFASTVAKRLESLGALTHGDRRATESRDLSRFNIDNKYGRVSLENVMKSSLGFESPLVAPPSDYQGDFNADVRKSLIGVGMVTVDDRINVPILDKDYNNISKFLNRILGMEVALQNALFKHFSQTLMAIILEAKRNGRWDMGILDLGSGGESVKKLESRVFVGNTATNTARTELTTFSVERGMSWTGASEIWRKYTGSEDGFYVSTQERSMKKTAVLAVYYGLSKKKEKMYNVYRPNTGRQVHTESLTNLKKKYKKVLPDVAKPIWDDQYNLSAKICSHAYWKGNCKKVSMGLPCEVGLRSRTFHVLSGSVLSVWSKVEGVLASMPGGANSKMQIIRLRTDNGQRIVGSLIPNNCVLPLCNILSQDCKQTFTEKHPVHEEDSSHLSMPLLF